MGGTQSHWNCRVEGSGERPTLVLAGAMDLASADMLRTFFVQTAEQASGIEVDLEHVTFLDSAGIHALVVGRNTALAHGNTFVVTRMSEPVRSVLRVTGLLNALTRPARL